MPLRPAVRAAAAAGLVVALALPASAFAGVLRHSDPAQDAQQITKSGSSTTITNAPDNKTADIVHVGARYGRMRLTETVRLRDLGRHWFLSSRIQTPARHFDVTLVHRPGTNQVTLTRGRRRIAVACAGLVREVDRLHHTASVTVPADCISAPPWVRIGTGIVAFGKARGVSFGDDALRRRGIAEANLTLSRKIPLN